MVARNLKVVKKNLLLVRYSFERVAKSFKRGELQRRWGEKVTLGRSGAKSMRSLLLPTFSSAFFRGSQTNTCVTCGLSKSCNQAAQVPSSKVTCKLPRRPWINCRRVPVFVSRMDSITNLPVESRTVAEIVA